MKLSLEPHLATYAGLLLNSCFFLNIVPLGTFKSRIVLADLSLAALTV